MYISTTSNATVSVLAGTRTLTSTPQPSSCESNCSSTGSSGWAGFRFFLAAMAIFVTLLSIATRLRIVYLKRRDENRRAAREAAEDVELDSTDQVQSISLAMRLFFNPGMGPLFDISSELVQPAATFQRAGDDGEEFPPPPYEEDPPPYHDFGAVVHGEITVPEVIHRV